MQFSAYTARKIRFSQICLGQMWCKKVQKMRKVVNTAFAYQFYGVVNSRANAVITIFVIDLTVVCTFLHHICNESI